MTYWTLFFRFYNNFSAPFTFWALTLGFHTPLHPLELVINSTVCLNPQKTFTYNNRLNVKPRK